MATLKTDLQAYYAERAEHYEEIYQREERQDDLDELQERLQEVLFGQHVLELACGTGYWTEQYADLAESVLATDITPEVLAIAEAKDIDKVEYAVMDAFDVQKPAGRTVTACFAGFWWSHVLREKQSGYLEQLRARLGKDTLLVLIDNNYVEGSSTVIARTDLEGNTFQIRTLENGDRYEVLKNFPTDSALRKKFADHAREIRILRNEFYWMLTCRLK
jgi:SAM-dependent methyltransferase